MPKLKEIFDLPEQVHQGDFVLKLADGLEAPAATVRDYVVTPQLAKCFDQALGVVKGAVDSRTSKGAYLHGSFGAGKSHFMAVLTLLLRGDSSARAKPQLAEVVQRHNGWTQGKTFLVVPYHMIGAETLEAALFSGYADYVARHFPKAPIPGFYEAEGLFADAHGLLASMGEEAFFRKLNEQGGSAGAPGGGGWGKVAQGWNIGRFEAAAVAPVGSDERFRLVGALTGAFYATQRKLSASRQERYTTLDEGLSAMSRHARDLGFDAVILFLDEFILWLASRAADAAWIAREGQKVAKLVESSIADRPVPIVSFMARQRDLRELVGEHMPGAQQLSFADTLQWWEARFDKVMLEDRNLPAIAKERLLRPRGAAEKEVLASAVDKLLRAHPEVVQTLLTRDGDQQMLRDLYPFTPALVQTLVAVSSMLQRERTALKLMLQILVEQGDTLEIGDVVPVGDLYDVIAEGDEPFTHGIKLFFEQAKQLWRRRLLPMLEEHHGITWEEIESGRADKIKATALLNDARLLKTLVLAALAPEVEALKSLTPTRLAALNHGTIRTPVLGSEAVTVLTKLKRWAGRVGEIKLADESANPVITLEVAGVDTESILGNAMSHDSHGNRQAQVRELITESMQLDNVPNGLFGQAYELIWRGSRREVEILFGNVREQSVETLRGRAGTWCILVDFPFDEPSHTPADDVARIESFHSDGHVGRTIAWLPSFLSPATLDQLGRLVVIEHVLRGANLDRYGQHLSQTDREQARMLLTNQRDQLRQFIRNCLNTAYGLNEITREAIDPAQALDEHFVSLDPSLALRPPVAANFEDAFISLAEQALNYEFPAHPEFEAEPKQNSVRRLSDLLVLAAQKPNLRVELEQALREDARRVAPKLGLADVGEAALVLKSDWPQHFTQMMHRESRMTPTVADLRRWIDTPKKYGLRSDLEDLIISTWLAQTNRQLFRNNFAFNSEVGNLPNECEAREQPLPTQEDWEKTRRLGAALFDGRLVELPRSARGLVDFGRILRERLRELIAPLADYGRAVNELMRILDTPHVAPEVEAKRAETAKLLTDWLARVEATSTDLELVSTMVAVDMGAEMEAEAQAVFSRIKPLAGAHFDSQMVKGLRDLKHPAYSARSSEVLSELTQAVLRHEYVTSLALALEEGKRSAQSLLIEAATQAQPPQPQPPPSPGELVVYHAQKSQIMGAEALRLLDEIKVKLVKHPAAVVDIVVSVREIR